MREYTDQELEQMAYDEAALRSLIGRQMGGAEALLGMGSPQGASVGGTYVAASPLEHISNVLAKAMGAYQMNKRAGDYKDSLGREAVVGGRAARMDLDRQAQVERLIQATLGRFGPQGSPQPNPPLTGAPAETMPRGASMPWY